ncbi:MAG: phosphate uptake regulator PhoU [Nanoarchaeota archaeon]|nr:MAG: phosphate uptake regulator PhoU [Nanoarchaeota archaeon]
MEHRKLIQFGKSAFCVTLPQMWIKKNKIEKGQSLSVHETAKNTIEISMSLEQQEENSNLTIDIAGKPTDEIIQLLLASYLNGYLTITLEGQNAGKVSSVRDYVHEFIAAEIMEVTSNKIVIHVFGDIKNVNLESIINRIGHIIKSLFEESIELVDSGIDIKDIIEKGYEVERQAWLARRAIKYSLTHSAAAQRFNMSPLELFYTANIKYFFGRIAEYIIQIAKIIGESILHKSISPKAKRELKAMIQNASNNFEKVLERYNTRKVRITEKEYQNFEESIDSFREKNSGNGIPVICEYLKMIIDKIKEIEFNIISLENAPK